MDEKSKKPPPMFTKFPINGVQAKSLIDTGSSDDFVGNHFVTTSRVSVQRHEKPLSSQRAVIDVKNRKVHFKEWDVTLSLLLS